MFHFLDQLKDLPQDASLNITDWLSTWMALIYKPEVK